MDWNFYISMSPLAHRSALPETRGGRHVRFYLIKHFVHLVIFFLVDRVKQISCLKDTSVIWKHIWRVFARESINLVTNHKKTHSIWGRQKTDWRKVIEYRCIVLNTHEYFSWNYNNRDGLFALMMRLNDVVLWIQKLLSSKLKLIYINWLSPFHGVDHEYL